MYLRYLMNLHLRVHLLLLKYLMNLEHRLHLKYLMNQEHLLLLKYLRNHFPKYHLNPKYQRNLLLL